MNFREFLSPLIRLLNKGIVISLIRSLFSQEVVEAILCMPSFRQTRDTVLKKGFFFLNLRYVSLLHKNPSFV